MVPTARMERNRRSQCRCGQGGRMRAGALVSPCHVMAGLVPAIHVFARSSTDLAERDARNKSGHDERSGRTGETARLTQSHANFRIRTLARLSNQGCGLRGDFWPHREGNGLPPATKGRPARPMGDGRSFSSTRDRLSRESGSTYGRQAASTHSAPKAPMRRPTSSYLAENVPAIPDGMTPTGKVLPTTTSWFE